MTRFMTAMAATVSLALAMPAVASAAEQVIVIDAPDLQKASRAASGFRTSEVIGTDVFSNANKRIGEVEDFAFIGGKFYAVIDIQDSPIEKYIDITDDDLVVVPLDQLRVMDRPKT